jgi:hypothetical protein
LPAALTCPVPEVPNHRAYSPQHEIPVEVYDERALTMFCVGVFMPVSSSFTKRQKERARQERQAEKARKKAEKKLEKDDPKPAGPRDPIITYDDDGQPEGLGFHDF